MSPILLLISAAIPASCTVEPPPAPIPHALNPMAVADELYAADRYFAAAAGGQTATAALGPMFDQGVVLFIVPLPGLVQGRADALAHVEKAFGKDRLSWTAVRVGISADGLQGFSYGFMDRASEGQAPKLGKYVAYWLKRPEGWRVAAFKWVPRPEGPVSTEVRAPALPERMVAPTNDAGRIEAYRAELDRTERQFSDDAQVTSIGAAFRKYGSADAMNVGGGADFTYGNEAIGAAQGGDAPAPSPLRWAPDGVIVASSGDLGLTYGYLDRNGPTPPGRLARIPFFTVWRRAAPRLPWRYVAE